MVHHVDAKDEDRRTPLFVASCPNDADVAAKWGRCKHFGRQRVHAAIRCSRRRLFCRVAATSHGVAMVELNPEFENTPVGEFSPLEKAAENGHPGALELRGL